MSEYSTFSGQELGSHLLVTEGNLGGQDGTDHLLLLLHSVRLHGLHKPPASVGVQTLSELIDTFPRFRSAKHNFFLRLRLKQNDWVLKRNISAVNTIYLEEKSKLKKTTKIQNQNDKNPHAIKSAQFCKGKIPFIRLVLRPRSVTATRFQSSNFEQ